MALFLTRIWTAFNIWQDLVVILQQNISETWAESRTSENLQKVIVIAI